MTRASTLSEGGVCSSTVSKLDFGPLGPLDGALVGAWSWSLSVAAFSFALVGCCTGNGGVELCTVMGGAELESVFLCDNADPRLELTAAGGGDLNRGDTGHCAVVGVLSPEGTVDLEVRGNFDTASVTGPGCS